MDDEGEVTLITDAELEAFLEDELQDYGEASGDYSRPNLHVIVGTVFDGIIIDDV